MKIQENSINKILKVIGIILLLLAMLRFPYGYYNFLRIVITAIAIYLIYDQYNNQGDKVWIFIFLFIGILFNPLFPIYLEKETWKIIDAVTSLIFFISLIKNFKSNGEKAY